jgi:Uma2 family endonuclease
VVVVEVLSESTRRTDLGEKRSAYLGVPSLKVLLLVETEEPRVVAHRRQVDGGFQIEHHVGLETVIPLPEIGVSLSLAEIYERIDFKD